jgi:hypothetical protein
MFFSYHDYISLLEIHTTEPLVLDSSVFEVEIGIAKLKSYKLSCSDQTLTKMIQAGGETV